MFKKIFIYFVLAILITLLIYTFYKSEIVWEGLKRDYYYKFYIFILATSIILIFYLFVSEKIKTYLIISFLSLIFSLYLSEFYFVYLSEKLSINKKIKIYKKSTGKDYDLRSPIQFYKEYNKSNTIIPAVTPNYYFKFSNIKKLNYDLFPFSGISNSKTFVCNENGYYSIFQSDRHGFNNPDKEWDSDEIEYLLIGDSYTQGSCINRPYDIASQLRVFSKKSVLNLGYGSTGPLIQYATLREYINKKIKKIIWIYYEGNDDSDLSYELNSNFLNKYLMTKILVKT